MKNLAGILCFLLGSLVSVSGQTPVQHPTPNQMQEIRDNVRRNEDIKRRFDMLRNGGRRSLNQGLARDIFFQKIIPLYRKPTKTELETIAPNAEDVRKYADFLKLSKTGMTKLAADFGCAENPSVVVATPNCLLYTMPGAGSSFSFRIGNYRIPRLADLTFTNEGFQTMGVLTHGILVNLGDVSLEEISFQTKGAKFLLDFVPSDGFPKAIETERQLVTGIERDGFSYRSVLTAEENKTYFLRSIAYRGGFMTTVQGIAYNELDFDKREDIFVAFRVIRKDEDGSITILWKELNSKKSPKLKARKEEINIKPNNLAENTK